MPSAAPLVSVIVRSMDRDTLARSMRSIAAQNCPRAEVVVVNASGRPHRALPALCGLHEVRVLEPGRPLPRAQAANAGLEQSRGQYLYFLDDDDEALPGAISALARALESNPGSQFAYGRSVVIDAQGKPLSLFGSAYRKELRLDCGFLTPGAFLMARGLVERGLRFDPELDILEDMEFFIQCSEVTQLTFIDLPVHGYWSESGTSGAGGVGNADPRRIQRALQYIARKWGGPDRGGGER
jgi:glycosyl transferase family 2